MTGFTYLIMSILSISVIKVVSSNQTQTMSLAIEVLYMWTTLKNLQSAY